MKYTTEQEKRILLLRFIGKTKEDAEQIVHKGLTHSNQVDLRYIDDGICFNM